jgi:hypothetical protein
MFIDTNLNFFVSKSINFGRFYVKLKLKKHLFILNYNLIITHEYYKKILIFPTANVKFFCSRKNRKNIVPVNSVFTYMLQ